MLTLRTVLTASVQRKVTLAKAIAISLKRPKSSRLIHSSDSSVKVSKLTLDIQRLTDVVESKDLRRQTMYGSVVVASRLR